MLWALRGGPWPVFRMLRDAMHVSIAGVTCCSGVWGCCGAWSVHVQGVLHMGDVPLEVAFESDRVGGKGMEEIRVIHQLCRS
jgi:hypothetical protein